MIIKSDRYPIEIEVAVSDVHYEDKQILYCIDRIWIEGVEIEGELYKKIEDMLYEVNYLPDDIQSQLESEALDRMIAQWEARHEGDR